MMRRFVMLQTIHMGPLMDTLKTGDVLIWDESLKRLSVKGEWLEEAKGMNFAEVIGILERQAVKDPQNAWASELRPVLGSSVPSEIKTDSQVILPILGCLQAAEDFLKQQVVNWTPVNEEQHQFLQRYLSAKSVVDSLGNNLRKKADRDYRVINAWLKENGFDIQLDPNDLTSSFCVASILDVLVEWVETGSVVSIYTPKGTFAGVKMKSNIGDVSNVVKFLDLDIHQFPIAGIKTKSNDLVRMTVLDSMPSGTFAITEKVMQLDKAVKQKNMSECDGVIFPMIDYNSQVDLSWIVNMASGPKREDYYIAQAMQQTKFRMNEQGARAESAAAMTMFRKCCAPTVDKWIRIDRPFLLWIERYNVPVPIFAGVFAEDVWKKPVGLK